MSPGGQFSLSPDRTGPEGGTAGRPAFRPADRRSIHDRDPFPRRPTAGRRTRRVQRPDGAAARVVRPALEGFPHVTKFVRGVPAAGRVPMHEPRRIGNVEEPENVPQFAQVGTQEIGGLEGTVVVDEEVQKTGLADNGCADAPRRLYRVQRLVRECHVEPLGVVVVVETIESRRDHGTAMPTPPVAARMASPVCRASSLTGGSGISQCQPGPSPMRLNATLRFAA